jgi:hypothetical protein
MGPLSLCIATYATGTIEYWYSRGSAVAPAAVASVLAFFTYYYVSQVFGIAQNRLFPLYVAAASLAGFALVFVASRLNAYEVAAALPAHTPKVGYWRRTSLK